MVGAALAYGAVALVVGADRGGLDNADFGGIVPGALTPNRQMSLVRNAIAKREASSAVRLGRVAILQAPLDPARLSAYGLAQATNGDQASGYQAFLLAAQMGWRDSATQIFWVQAALQLNDAPVAATRLDGLWRAHPLMVDQLELTEPFDKNPDYGNALIARMQSKPEWVDGFVGSTRLLEGERLNNRVNLLMRLADAGTRVGCDKISQVVNPLVRHGMFDAAIRLWRSHCDDRPAGVVMDGNFSAYNPAYEEVPPFRWAVPASGDLNVSEMPQQGGGKLLVMQNNSPTGLVSASQLIMAESGTYKLSWRATDQAGKMSDAMTPRLWCDDAKQVDTDKPVAMPDGRWSATIRLPERACPAWHLQFTLRPTPYPITFGSVMMVK